MVLSSHCSIKSVVTEFTLGSIALTSCIVLDKLLKLSTLVSQSLKCRQYNIYLIEFMFGILLDNVCHTFSRDSGIYSPLTRSYIKIIIIIYIILIIKYKNIIQ